MQITCSTQSRLTKEQAKTVCIDLCRMLNFFSPEGEIASVSDEGMTYKGSSFFPKCVRFGELEIKADGELTVTLDVDPKTGKHELAEIQNTLLGKLERYFGYPTIPFGKKIFCIGWSKTGTMSLVQALRMLGIFSWHFAPWMTGFHHFSDETSSYKLDFSSIENYTAIADLPVPLFYKELDEAFPGSLFIFTTRPIESWLPSALADAEKMASRLGMLEAVYRFAYGVEKPQEKSFLARYNQHNQEVLEYFFERSDCLSIDITSGNPWKGLCDFLNLPIPDKPFPHLNRLSSD